MWIVHSPGAAISLKDRCVQSSSEHPSRTERQQDLQAASIFRRRVIPSPDYVVTGAF